MEFVNNARFSIILLVITGMLINGCSEEPQLWKVVSQEQVICDYITCHPDQFSEFWKLIEITEMGSLLKVRGPFTLFLPTNDAMLEYYNDKDLSSLEDLSESSLRDLILNHIVGMEIATNEIGLGTLREPNALGDYLVTEFRGSDIIVSKYSKIIDRDICTANGRIHVIDKVLDPITKDIYHVILSDPSYTIFTEGIEISGLMDTLQLTSIPYGESVARTRFTILAVADTIYQRYGIQSVQDLIEWTGANPDSIRFLDNPFYRYMEYHCLNGTYYLSDLETGFYPIFSRDNYLSIRIDNEDYKINLDKTTKNYTGFIIPASNVPAKNGAQHAINDILPITDPEPFPVLFETTDFFDLKHEDYYLEHHRKFFDGENTFAKIKWEGDYMLYYFKEGTSWSLNNCDCLSTIGWWKISITFPKVMKGKYDVFVYQPGWSHVSTCQVYIDGVSTNYFYNGRGDAFDSNGLQKVAVVDFPTTAEHTITLRNMNSGQLFWDYVLFEPVK